jgi:hypothetical protein
VTAEIATAARVNGEKSKQLAASGVTCPGAAPKVSTQIGPSWVDLNPGGKCDLIYAVTKGTVEFRGNDGGYTVAVNDPVVGRKDTKILIEARATSGSAELYYMLCPLGTGPVDGGWQCRPE